MPAGRPAPAALPRLTRTCSVFKWRKGEALLNHPRLSWAPGCWYPPPCPAASDPGVPARGCRGRKGDVPGTLPQCPQRAGGMPELLAELQDAVGSQLIVAQVQAGEVGALHQPGGQGSAAGARQPAAPQPAGPRQTGMWGLAGRLVSCSGWDGGNAGPAAPYRSVCSWQARRWSPSHSSCAPASRSPSLKDKSSSSKRGLVPSTVARSSQQALVRREYHSLPETRRKHSEPARGPPGATPSWRRSPPRCHCFRAPHPGRVGQRDDATLEGLFWGTSPALHSTPWV